MAIARHVQRVQQAGNRMRGVLQVLALSTMLGVLKPLIVTAQPSASTCAPIAVYADAVLGRTWQTAAAELRDEIAKLPPGECNASRLWISAAGPSVVLRVEGAGGRAAEREVRDPAQPSAI